MKAYFIRRKSIFCLRVETKSDILFWGAGFSKAETESPPTSSPTESGGAATPCGHNAHTHGKKFVRINIYKKTKLCYNNIDTNYVKGAIIYETADKINYNHKP